MHYPEILTIMVLMFSDYYLTIWGNKLRNEGHSNFFELENYELNPIWQKNIRGKKVFNVRQLAMTLVAFCFFIYVFEYDDLNIDFKQGLIGSLLAHYGMLTGRHISNLLTFNYTKKHPEDLCGKIKQSHEISLHNSSYQFFVAIVPIVIIAVVNPEPLLIGCAIGALFNIILHKLWISRYRNSKQKYNKANSADVKDRAAD